MLLSASRPFRRLRLGDSDSSYSKFHGYMERHLALHCDETSESYEEEDVSSSWARTCTKSASTRAAQIDRIMVVVDECGVAFYDWLMVTCTLEFGHYFFFFFFFSYFRYWTDWENSI